mmetsp:Transcript_34819/g.97690  ORF Transcript_34819/g.97690 Transcript_34819/m.97690 type:complete len:380 (+) Transcript_34819:56-1195(+)
MYTGYFDVLSLAQQREEARRDSNYREADRIRTELNQRGAELNDTRHTFTFKGLVGGYDLHGGMGLREIQYVALEREEARRDQDFSRADELRDWLMQLNVSVEDKSHTARLSDGSTISYDLHAQQAPSFPFAPAPPQAPAPSQAPCLRGAMAPHPAARQPVGYQPPAFWQGMQQPPPPPAGMPPAMMPPAMMPPVHMQPAQMMPAMMPHGASDSGDFQNGHEPGGPQEPHRFQGYTEALLLGFEREEARRDSNYAEADRVRNELGRRGVELFDRTHTFTYNGLQGTYDLRTGIGPQEVQYAALEREEARRDRNYARSDQLRAWLAEQGITVDDKVHTFTMPSGCTGSYDLRSWEPVFDEGSRGGFDDRGGPPKRPRQSYP